MKLRNVFNQFPFQSVRKCRYFHTKTLRYCNASAWYKGLHWYHRLIPNKIQEKVLVEIEKRTRVPRQRILSFVIETFSLLGKVGLYFYLSSFPWSGTFLSCIFLYVFDPTIDNFDLSWKPISHYWVDSAAAWKNARWTSHEYRRPFLPISSISL